MNKAEHKGILHPDYDAFVGNRLRAIQWTEAKGKVPQLKYSCDIHFPITHLQSAMHAEQMSQVYREYIHEFCEIAETKAVDLVGKFMLLSDREIVLERMREAFVDFSSNPLYTEYLNVEKPTDVDCFGEKIISAMFGAALVETPIGYVLQYTGWFGSMRQNAEDHQHYNYIETLKLIPIPSNLKSKE